MRVGFKEESYSIMGACLKCGELRIIRVVMVFMGLTFRPPGREIRKRKSFLFAFSTVFYFLSAQRLDDPFESGLNFTG